MALKKIILILILVFSNLGYSTSSKIENHVSHAVIAPLITSFTPASGPKGTRVTITGSGFSATSQVNFNGFNATTLYINSTTLQALVPLIATGENQTITVIDSGVSTNAATFFTLNTTLGTCASFTDLIISEVYDSGTGNVWYMELYNPTNTPIILNAPGSIYKLERYGSIGNPSPTRTIDLTGTVLPNSVYTLKLGNASPNTCNAITYNFTETGAGINEDDEIRLTKNGLPIDVVYCPDETGYTIKRNSNASGPSNIYDATEWTTLLSETCTDLGQFTVSNNLPTINSHPIDVTGCPSTATFAVGASATGILTYQWYYNNGTNTNWTLLTSVFPGVTISVTASPSLSLSGNLTTLNGYQFYCAVSLNASCTVISNAATLDISSTTTPTFNQISPICPGQSFTLPSASTNSTAINGTWSPAINTTTTTTYTFTPTAGQCATTTTMTIVIKPAATLALTSATGTANQTVCTGNALIPIAYTFGGSATGATVTGLPAGITASTSGNVLTISGTAATNFNYTITTVDGCSPIILGGNVVITANATLNLTSAAGTDNQTICIGTAITPIEYTFGGGATSATVSGLPAEITASTAGNVVTISGTPAGNFNYTITTVGGCGIITLNGAVVVNPNATLVLTSAAGTDNQTICVGNTITPIQYTFGGGVTGATVTGLPAGITASTTGNVVAINGIPSGNFNYTITTVGGCGSSITLNGSVTTTTGITPIFAQEAPVCSGIPLNITTTSTNGIVGTWQEISNTASTITYEFNPYPGQCATTTTMTVVVTPRPTVTITSPSTSYCAGSSTNITLTSTVPGTTFTWNALSSNLDTTQVFSGNGATIAQTLNLVNDLNVGFVTYSVTPFANGCSGTPQEITIFVNPTPIMTAVATTSAICSGDTANIDLTSNISGVTYSWTFSATGVTGASNGNGININQVLTSADATTGGFVIYTITPSLNGCIGLPVTVQIDVKPRPEFFGTIPTTVICSGESINIGLSASIAGTTFNWTVFSSDNVTGATAGSGIAIIEILEAPTVQGTVVYTVIPVLNGCSGAPITVTVTVNPLPKPMLADGTLCIIEVTGEVYQTYTLNTGLSAAGNSFDWFLDGVLIPAANGPTLVANQVGLYSVIVTNTTTTCKSEEVFATVDFVYPANSFTTVVTDAFSNNAPLR